MSCCFNMCCDSDNQSQGRLISDRDQRENVCTVSNWPCPVCVGLRYLYCINIWKKVQSNTVRTLVYSNSLSLCCSCASSNNGACFRSWFLSADWLTYLSEEKVPGHRQQKKTHTSTHIRKSEQMESYANADVHWNMGTSHKHAVKTHTFWEDAYTSTHFQLPPTSCLHTLLDRLLCESDKPGQGI